MSFGVTPGANFSIASHYRPDTRLHTSRSAENYSALNPIKFTVKSGDFLSRGKILALPPVENSSDISHNVILEGLSKGVFDRGVWGAIHVNHTPYHKAKFTERPLII